MSAPFLIIPCSGIGKPFGTISRDATYRVVEDLKKGETDTMCLSLLVRGDEDAKRQVKTRRCIAIDGCPNECAKKNRSLKPTEVTFLDKDGRSLSQIVAEKVASKVDELSRECDVL